MQFIAYGPDVPNHLLEAHEEGRLIFFCGAGISYPAGLKDFKGLVADIYTGLSEVPDALETAAMEAEYFDTVIGLLEKRIVSSRLGVRHCLARSLTPDLGRKNAIATHAALLSLARNRNGQHRIVTTNFDRLFELAMAQEGLLGIPSFKAPLLPVPKSKWNGIVYLHGLLNDPVGDDDLQHLVASSGDFGLAYLTERWASRFVGELFRNYIVCFVGYSINDPVLRYMMDALAADKLLGEAPNEVFAFVGYDEGDRPRTETRWLSKNVTPVLYLKDDTHSLLHATLIAWADTYRDGILGKRSILTQYGSNAPNSTLEDGSVGRVLWALNDASGLPAKHFSTLDPSPPFEWLDVFLSQPVSSRRSRATMPESGLLTRIMPRQSPIGLPLVFKGSDALPGLDATSSHLAFWLSRNISDPRLLFWVSHQGGELHPDFAENIKHALSAWKDIPDKLRVLWQLVLNGRMASPKSDVDFWNWRDSLSTTGLTTPLKLELYDLLRPRLILHPPWRIGLAAADKTAEAGKQVHTDVRSTITVGNGVSVWELKQLFEQPEWEKALPSLFDIANNLLREAIDLLHAAGEIDSTRDGSRLVLPSIERHEQNQYSDDWSPLVEMVRDAWLQLVSRNAVRARAEVARWAEIDYPVFRRLVLYAGTITSVLKPKESLSELLKDGGLALWMFDTQREAIRLMAHVLPFLTSVELNKVARTILKGPPLSLYKRGISTQEYQEIRDREVWMILAKWSHTNVGLVASALRELARIQSNHPTWILRTDDQDEFVIWHGANVDMPEPTIEKTPESLEGLVKWLTTPPKPNQWEQIDDWADYCRNHLDQSCSALAILATRGQWPLIRWQTALSVWSDDAFATQTWPKLQQAIESMPANEFMVTAYQMARWIEKVVVSETKETKQYVDLIRRLLNLSMPVEHDSRKDYLFQAWNHPMGIATSALFNWWFRQSLKDGGGIQDEILSTLTHISDSPEPTLCTARTIMAMHTVALYRVDEMWTVNHFLQRFDWQASIVEAASAWQGFVWAYRINDGILVKLKSSFVATANYYAELGGHGERYSSMVAFVALNKTDIVSHKELGGLLKALPDGGLEQVAQALLKAIGGVGEAAPAFWTNRVAPVLAKSWPKESSRVTPHIATTFARLCIEARGAFPEAVNLLLPWLEHVHQDGFVIRELHESQLSASHPEASLRFLSSLIKTNNIWNREALANCLRQVVATNPDLKKEASYMRLIPFTL